MGPVMLDLEGTCLSDRERNVLTHPCVGGVILFTRNYEAPEQVSVLIDDLRSICGSDLLIAVDQEGGRVQRFRPGLTPLPAAARYAANDREDTAKALERAASAGWLMASELLALGVDFSFAPVLDVDCGISEIIGDRAFSDRPEIVAEMALAFRSGMNRAGMAAVGKHFPGHGGVALDSHLVLPEDKRSFEQILARDLLPFRKLIDAGLEGIMPAHVVYSEVDSRPAGFSLFWIEEVLRRRLGFAGAVFSDDLSMEGAAFAGGYSERAKKALAAGCDMVLVCNRPDAAEEVLDALLRDWDYDPVRCQRLLTMRARGRVERSVLLGSAEWRRAVDDIEQLNARA
jgi:beta-N-acetylhexosaminidase